MLLFQSLFEEVVIDRAFEDFDAVAIDAFLGQIAHGDLLVVDDCRHGGHFLAFDRVVHHDLDFGRGLQFLEQVGAQHAQLAFADRVGEQWIDLCGRP